MLFVGMLAALVGQANMRDILQRLVLNSTQGFSKQRFMGEKTEWSPQGGYGYFVTATVAPTLHILSQAMAGFGAVVALTFTRWVVKTLVRLGKTSSTARE